MPEEAKALQPSIGRYAILSKLGEGGMAEIFLAEIRGTKGFTKRVVVKMLLDQHQADDQQLSMFADEARVGSQMEYPHIPRVLELGEHRGLPFMVQEFVDGPSLSAILKRQRELKRINLRMAVRIVADVARALDHAHRLVAEDGTPLRLVHRDVSPSNILVGKQGVAKLIDFGVARFENRETHTEANLLKGKLRYLAPETITDGVVSHQTDVFALGVVLYIATTARAPWRNAQDLARRMQGTFDRPSDIVPSFSRELEDVIMGCLAPDPAHRTADAATLVEQLEGWLQATGGRVRNDELATFVRDLFPDGAEAWLPTYDLDRTTLSALRVSDLHELGDRRTLAAAALGAGAIASIAILALLATSVLAYNLYHRAPEVIVETVDPTVKARADFLELLERAEQAKASDDRAAARRHLRALDRIAVSDPPLLDRQLVLEEWADLLDEVDALRARLAEEPKEVLAQAEQLHEQHPTSVPVEQLLEDARAAVAAAKPAPAAPRPAPRPVATEPSLLTVDGSPPGAEVVVDGRFVGTIPLQLVVDPGPHDVALRMEGFVQRRQNIEANGAPISVKLALPALKAP